MDPFSPIDRLYVHIPVSATLHDGAPVSLTSADVALLPFRVSPTSDTQWATFPVVDGEVVALVAGAQANPAGALVLPANGAVAWVRETDNPEVKAVSAGFIPVC